MNPLLVKASSKLSVTIKPRRPDWNEVAEDRVAEDHCDDFQRLTIVQNHGFRRLVAWDNKLLRPPLRTSWEVFEARTKLLRRAKGQFLFLRLLHTSEYVSDA